jgi:hypothetical protein
VKSLAVIFRYVVGSQILAIGLAAPLAAQTATGSAGHCVGLPSFGSEDSLNRADLQVATNDLLVRVSPKGPELHLRLEPDPAWKSNQETAGGAGVLQRVGWIRVFSCETGAFAQSLEVESLWGGPELFLRFFELKDINFDGYLDVAVVRDGGATWASQTWWVYSPTSGKFISNDFTQALSRIDNNGLQLDEAHQDITAYRYSYPEGCGQTKDIYHVEQNRRLALLHKEDPKSKGDSCQLTTRDLVGGEMRVTKVERLHEFSH